MVHKRAFLFVLLSLLPATLATSGGGLAGSGSLSPKSKSGSPVASGPSSPKGPRAEPSRPLSAGPSTPSKGALQPEPAVPESPKSPRAASGASGGPSASGSGNNCVRDGGVCQNEACGQHQRSLPGKTLGCPNDLQFCCTNQVINLHASKGNKPMSSPLKVEEYFSKSDHCSQSHGRCSGDRCAKGELPLIGRALGCHVMWCCLPEALKKDIQKILKVTDIALPPIQETNNKCGFSLARHMPMHPKIDAPYDLALLEMRAADKDRFECMKPAPGAVSPHAATVEVVTRNGRPLLCKEVPYQKERRRQLKCYTVLDAGVAVHMHKEECDAPEFHSEIQCVYGDTLPALRTHFLQNLPRARLLSNRGMSKVYSMSFATRTWVLKEIKRKTLADNGILDSDAHHLFVLEVQQGRWAEGEGIGPQVTYYSLPNVVDDAGQRPIVTLELMSGSIPDRVIREDDFDFTSAWGQAMSLFGALKAVSRTKPLIWEDASSPNNMMFTASGRLAFSDFGLDRFFIERTGRVDSRDELLLGLGKWRTGNGGGRPFEQGSLGEHYEIGALPWFRLPNLALWDQVGSPARNEAIDGRERDFFHGLVEWMLHAALHAVDFDNFQVINAYNAEQGKEHEPPNPFIISHSRMPAPSGRLTREEQKRAAKALTMIEPGQHDVAEMKRRATAMREENKAWLQHVKARGGAEYAALCEVYKVPVFEGDDVTCP